MLYNMNGGERPDNSVPRLQGAFSGWPSAEFLIRGDIEKEWVRQAESLIRLGFHKLLNLSENEYLASLPHFGSQPEIFREKFYIPVIAEPRIPPSSQCLALKIENLVGQTSIRDWSDNPQKWQTPRRPYIVWMEDGSLNTDLSVFDVRSRFLNNRFQESRAATAFDGFAYYRAHPEILKARNLQFPGSQVERDYTPALFGKYLEGGPKFNATWIRHPYPGFTPLICGFEPVG